MATIVQRITGTSVANAGTLVMSGNVTAGNHIAVISIHSYLGCPPSVTDSQGNTYTARVVATQPSGGWYFYVWTAPVVSSGACTLTFTMGCGNLPIVAAVEVSGLNATTPFGGFNVSANTVNPVVAGSITPTVNGSYLAAIFSTGGGTLTPMSGWSEIVDTPNVYFQDVIQTTAASIAPEATASFSPSSVAGYTAFFNAAASGGTRRRPQTLTPRRAFKKPVSRIVTRTWAGQPRVVDISVVPPGVGNLYWKIFRKRRG